MYLGFNRFIGDCLVCETDYFRRNPIPRGIFDENFGSLKKTKVYIDPNSWFGQKIIFGFEQTLKLKLSSGILFQYFEFL